MAPTKHRSIRVDDKTWEKAQRVADFYDTNVSALIVEYLKKLHTGYRRPGSQAKRRANEILPKRPPGWTAPNPHPKGIIPPRMKKVVPPPEQRIKLDPAVCPHSEEMQRVVSYGTFCSGCGSNMAKIT